MKVKQISTLRLGQAIKSRRVREELTLREFGNRVGITHVHVCRIENHGSSVSITTLNAICRVLGVDPDELIAEALE